MIKQELRDKQLKGMIKNSAYCLESAWSKGYDEGYEQGYGQGIEVGKALMTEQTHTNPEDTYREDFGCPCKPSNSPIDERKDYTPINLSIGVNNASEGVFEVLWTDCEKEQSIRFSDIENALDFADLLLNSMHSKDGVMIRRMKW